MNLVLFKNEYVKSHSLARVSEKKLSNSLMNYYTYYVVKILFHFFNNSLIFHIFICKQ